MSPQYEDLPLFQTDRLSPEYIRGLVAPIPEAEKEKFTAFRAIASTWAIDWDLPQDEYLRRCGILENILWPPDPVAETETKNKGKVDMAVLQQPQTSNPFGDLPPVPEGTFYATCIDVKDEFGVERNKYEQPGVTEVVDLTCFLFGFRDAQGNAHKISSKRMKISAHKNAALFKFLTSWLGKAPKMGWDYCELKGAEALMTVENDDGRSRIIGISPKPTQAAAPAAPPAAPAAPPAMAEDDDEVPF